MSVIHDLHLKWIIYQQLSENIPERRTDGLQPDVYNGEFLTSLTVSDYYCKTGDTTSLLFLLCSFNIQLITVILLIIKH